MNWEKCIEIECFSEDKEHVRWFTLKNIHENEFIKDFFYHMKWLENKKNRSIEI